MGYYHPINHITLYSPLQYVTLRGYLNKHERNKNNKSTHKITFKHLMIKTDKRITSNST